VHDVLRLIGGGEQVELTQPRDAVTAEGARVEIVSVSAGKLRRLLMPGGTVNADTLRVDPAVQRFVRDIVQAGKPVGVICHAPWTLIDAEVARGRTLTSYPSVWTDLRNAGATVVDEEVVTDNGLVSSCRPDDLPAFCAKIVEEFAEGAHPVA